MRKAGMTLIELVLTISIIVLLALLLVPKLMNAAPHLAAASEGLRARADLDYAQQLAIAHNTPCRVVFDRSGGRIVMQERIAGTFTTISERQLDLGVTISSSTIADDTVTFDELGEPDNAGTVSLRAPNGSVVTVTVAPGTGAVTVVSNGRPL
ncbi:MAG: prepilin-type N-terminal cleavage/methylation domain-containing protein [Verrucomicrobia bacterium]|nr:prepilin-type N-terminal cleavage/methylation domain-containing protein [Verrucomicrobiota bacterium]